MDGKQVIFFRLFYCCIENCSFENRFIECLGLKCVQTTDVVFNCDVHQQKCRTWAVLRFKVMWSDERNVI
jgi:hypothetical protein